MTPSKYSHPLGRDKTVAVDKVSVKKWPLTDHHLEF